MNSSTGCLWYPQCIVDSMLSINVCRVDQGDTCLTWEKRRPLSCGDRCSQLSFLFVKFEYFHGENTHRGNLSIFRFMALLVYSFCRAQVHIILCSLYWGSNASISVRQ